MDKDSLLGSPAPDFNDPLGLLRACHGRIEGHLQTLLKLADHIEQQGVDADARKAASNIHRYFTTAAVHHHQDEEQDLFPRLVRQSLKLADVIHGLKQDHARLEAAWQAIEPLLARPANISDIDAFRREAQAMADAYRAHIEHETSDLLDVAQHILSSDELRQMGITMAERRGLRPKYY